MLILILLTSGLQILNIQAKDYSFQNHDELSKVNSLSKANFDFAFDLYKMVSNGDNIVVSPFSVGMAWSMTMAGARDKTLQEIVKVLRLTSFNDLNEVNEAFAAVIRSMETIPDYTMFIANGLYSQTGFSIKKSFNKTLSTYFNSSCKSVDFSHDSESSRIQINKWVRDQTSKKIENILSAEDWHSVNSLVVVNALYFHSKWAKQMEVNQEKSPFIISGRKKQLVDMMQLYDTVLYGESQDLNSKILQLNYSRSRLVVYFILPIKVDGIKTLKQKMSAKAFATLKSTLSTQFTRIQIPKFSLKPMEELSDVFQHMKMSAAFNPELASFQGIAQPDPFNLYVNEFVHESYVEINEEGVEKAQVRTAASKTTLEPTAEFIADHPFVFIIFDTVTNFVLFIGNVDNPNKF